MKKILCLIIAIIASAHTCCFSENQSVKAMEYKVAYLTFDDGPSINTMKILDCLNEYGIKATFFVIKRDGCEHIYNRIVAESHELGGHSYTHDYSKIYQSADAYYDDLNRLNNYVKDITGKRFRIIRFPGGSNNLVSNNYSKTNVMKAITHQANYYGYEYFDWNVDAEDSTKNLKDSNTIANNVISQCKNKDRVIILMHDGPFAKTTPDSLPIIINELLSEGYLFKTITHDTPVMKF